MEWPIIVAIVVGIPIVLLPVVFIWFINTSGIYTVMRETRRRRVTQRKRAMAAEIAKS
jgi:hypothetical protein